MKKVYHQNSSFFSLRFLIVYFVFVFSILSVFSSGMFDSEDGWLYLTVSRNIYYNHEATAAPNEYPTKNVNMNSVQGSDGKWHAPYALGYSLAMVPAVALSDIIHSYYHSPPPVHFPLESDWSVLFFASFTNIFFASLLAVIMLLYGQSLGMRRAESLALSLLTIFATNLFPQSKFSFPHLMFTSMMMLAFYSLRRQVQTQQRKYFFLALISIVCMVLSYNQTYFLVFPALALFYFLLNDRKRRPYILKVYLVLFFLLVIVLHSPLFRILSGFHIYFKVVFEGVWGFLFSSGKSIFLYSPPLLLLPIFWHKVRQDEILPELASYLLLTFTILIVVGSVWIGSPEAKAPIWHGGMSWGPRYASTLIPGLMILVFHIINKLSRWQKRLIVIPIFVVSIGIQLVGVSVIYLLQYVDLPYSIHISQYELAYYDYASFIPRFSPLIKLPYSVASVARKFMNTINHGKYDLRFYDGFDFPLYSGNSISRGFREEGYIALRPRSENDVVNLRIQNVPDLSTASESATIQVKTQGTVLEQFPLKIQQEQLINIPMQQLPQVNGIKSFSLTASYTATPSAPHVIYIKELTINSAPQNLGSLDYPDVSSLGYATTPIPYQYYGNEVRDPWILWGLRARMNEQTFDFWWIKNLYYWDRPQTLIWLLFIIDLSTIIGSSFYLVSHISTQNGKNK